MKGKIDRHRSIIKNLIRYSFSLGGKVGLAISWFKVAVWWLNKCPCFFGKGSGAYANFLSGKSRTVHNGAVRLRFPSGWWLKAFKSSGAR